MMLFVYKKMPLIGRPGSLSLQHVKSALLLWLVLMQSAGEARSQQFLEDAQFVDLRVSKLSYTVDNMASGYGNLAGGGTYSFDRWYDGNFVDLRLTMLTPVNRNLGIYWGFGTGESGEKYRIDPSVKLGFLAIKAVGDDALVSFSMSVVLGGYLREKSCTADYGAIGGVQTVNCRMAGSVLPPSETLKFLKDQPPSDQVSISLNYRWRF